MQDRLVLEPGALLAVERNVDWRVVAAAAAAAVGTDLALQSGLAGISGALLVAAVIGGLLLSGRVTNPHGIALTASAALFGGWLAWRVSPWLLPLDILACGLLLVAGASLAREGSLFDITVPAAITRAVHAVLHGLAAPAFLVRGWVSADGGRDRPGTGFAVLRGLAIALPLVTVLGLLMGSADAVFAGFFRFWSPTDAIGHAVLLVVGAWGMTGLLRLASAEPCPRPPTFALRIGPVEATVVLASVVALFSAFAFAQLVVLADGGRHVMETAGLTYAEYARTGFFQLLAVAALTLGVLVAFKPLVHIDDQGLRARLTVLAEVCVGLTLLVLAVALRRLALYEEAFGLTMLRLFSQAFAVWIGLAILMLGVALAGVGRHRAWFPAAAAVAGLCVLFVLNVVNPEELVVNRNVEHASETGRFDPVYLADLSDDAVPALVGSLPRLSPADREVVLEAVCTSTASSNGGSPRGWAAANRSHSEADRARDRVCAPVKESGPIPA